MVSLFGRKRDPRTMGGGYVSNATVTRLEDVAEHVCNELDRLRAENAALRAFVAATDEWWVGRKKLLGVGIGPEMVAIRQRLATDFNLPLPEMDGGDR